MEFVICITLGKNGQSWKFKVITLIDQISNHSIYKKWMKDSLCSICVFLDSENLYYYVKNIHFRGVTIQNIMLSTRFLGSWSCWIGKLLEKLSHVLNLIKLDENGYKFMNFVTLGYKSIKTLNLERRDINSCLLEDGGGIG